MQATMSDAPHAPPQVALVTGAAHRIGAAVARHLHARGMNIALHYRASKTEAEALALALNLQRPNSVTTIAGDLLDTPALNTIVTRAEAQWGRLDALVNNASSFYPTPVDDATETQWDDLMGTNLKAPFFLAQAARPFLKRQQGCIVNIIDIHAQKPMKGFPIYSMAKAGLQMLTMSLARELGPEIRVNGVAPGAILWPQEALDSDTKAQIIDRTALKRQGSAEEIARAVYFMIHDANYISGQVLNVDGGRTLNH